MIELPLVQELTNEKVLAEGDLNRLLGTLRYLQSLKTAREKVVTEPGRAAQGGHERSAPTEGRRVDGLHL